jgi:D-arabinose 1-dehydrogenase-like Zn-dependent alcohol dehydrogenase
VGQYAIQLLKWYGYENVTATASTKHHDLLKSYGAKNVVDYRSPDAEDLLKRLFQRGVTAGKVIVLDCVNSQSSSLGPLSRVVTSAGSKIAALFPVLISQPSKVDPSARWEVSFDVQSSATWASGVEVHGVGSMYYEAVSNSLRSLHEQYD